MIENIDISAYNTHEVEMQLLNNEYTRKKIHNGCEVRIENSITQDNCSASLGKSHDTEQLPSNYSLILVDASLHGA